MELTDSEFFKIADLRAKQYKAAFPRSNPYLSFRRGYEIALREIIMPYASRWRTDKPDVHKWVIISTPNCKYPACAAYWNGTNWIDEQKRIIENVTHWAEVIPPVRHTDIKSFNPGWSIGLEPVLTGFEETVTEDGTLHTPIFDKPEVTGI